METTLDALWELLKNSVFEASSMDSNVQDKKKNMLRKAEEAEISVTIIDKFFNQLVDNISNTPEPIPMPLHLITFRKALEEFDTKSVSGIKEGAIQANNLAKDCGMCAVCSGCAERFYENVVNGNNKERALPVQLENYFLLPTQMHYYQSGLAVSKERRQLNNTLLCLKGFSSSTPTIHSATFSSDCVGGGLYINYQGMGIVIDPGIGFVNSMHKHGIFITDVDLVIITHDHLDHNADAAVISSLLYDYNRYSMKKNKIVQEIFEIQRENAHEITWIIDGDSCSKLSKQIEKSIQLKKYLGRPKQIFSKNRNLKLSAIKTEHIKDNSETYGIKILMEFDEGTFVLGYTSDTGYFPELSDFFADVDLLIFNISDIYKKDVKGIKDKHSHLGYNGSVKLLRQISPKMAIASEFCCTNGDFRVNIIKSLNKEKLISKDCEIFPGEIGLNVELPTLQVECSICKRKVSYKNINIVGPKKEFGKIEYICRNCL